VGMMVLTGPWHWVGLLGMPRRMAYFDYTNAAIAPQAWTVIVSTLGGFVLLASALLFVWVLATAKKTTEVTTAGAEAFTFSVAVHMPARMPLALNGFGIWVALMVALTVVNYGFPIAQLATLKNASVPAIPVGGR
jgi:cytochrome c oxidase subunit I